MNDLSELTNLLEKYLEFDWPEKERDRFVDFFPGGSFNKRLIMVTRQHVIHVLEKYIRGEITEEGLANWASDVFMQTTTPIALEPGYADFLAEVLLELDELASMEEKVFSIEYAKSYIQSLKNKEYDPNSLE
ncbi:MAG: hypothetical protein KTR14_08080 [Vampirovibrio sp.]|nr:hypothetical protein [Vampirovibrio sp.]